MRPRVLEVIGGIEYLVCSNWDRFELSVGGELVLAGDSAGALFHGLRLVNERYLIILIDGGVCAHGFRVYDLRERRWQPEVTSAEILIAGVHPRAPVVALVFDDHIHLFDLESRSDLAVIEDPGTVAVAFHPTESSVLAVGSFETVALIDTTSGRTVSQVSGGHHGDVEAVAWVTAELFATADAQVVKLWRRADLSEVAVAELHEVQSMLVSPDARRLGLVLGDRTFRELEVESLTEIGRESNVAVAAYDPEGQLHFVRAPT